MTNLSVQDAEEQRKGRKEQEEGEERERGLQERARLQRGWPGVCPSDEDVGQRLRRTCLPEKHTHAEICSAYRVDFIFLHECALSYLCELQPEPGSGEMRLRLEECKNIYSVNMSSIFFY